MRSSPNIALEINGAACVQWMFRQSAPFDIILTNGDVWVVERSIAWAERNRLTSREYNRIPELSDAFIYLGFATMLPNRLYQLLLLVLLKSVFWHGLCR